MVEEPEKFVSRGNAGPQVRQRRRDGWSRRDKRVFLAHFRATCNVTASARAAGKGDKSAWNLRNRDPEFAAEWDAALRDAEVRLMGKLVVHAETKGKVVESEDGEPAVAGIEDFDPDLAIRLIKLRQGGPVGRHGHRGGGRPQRAGKAELIAQLKKQFAALDRRKARRAA
jgi:hypothetical protein